MTGLTSTGGANDDEIIVSGFSVAEQLPSSTSFFDDGPDREWMPAQSCARSRGSTTLALWQSDASNRRSNLEITPGQQRESCGSTAFGSEARDMTQFAREMFFIFFPPVSRRGANGRFGRLMKRDLHDLKRNPPRLLTG